MPTPTFDAAGSRTLQIQSAAIPVVLGRLALDPVPASCARPMPCTEAHR